MLDWIEHGESYAAEMIAVSKALPAALDAEGLPVFAKAQGFTQSHQFAVEAALYGGGQTLSKKLRKAGFLACGIGLPIAKVDRDMNGLRIGTPELVRWGVTTDRARELAALIATVLNSDAPETLAARMRALRAEFDKLKFVTC